jgi:hypothetical protein
MPPLESHPILVCILKLLRPKLLIDPWDQLASLNLKRFGAMLEEMIGF